MGQLSWAGHWEQQESQIKSKYMICEQTLSSDLDLNPIEADKLDLQITKLSNGHRLELLGMKPRDKVKRALFNWLALEQITVEITWKSVESDLIASETLKNKFKVVSVDDDYVRFKPYIKASNANSVRPNKIVGTIQLLINEVISLKLVTN